eukprot:gene8207-14144_t
MARDALFFFLLISACGKFRLAISTEVKGFIPLGCYNDGNNERLMPLFINDFRGGINWKDMSLTVKQCFDAIKSLEHENNTPGKYRFFAIQFYGECWAGGETVAQKYFLSGTSTNCYQGTGGSGANFVYKIGTDSAPQPVPPSFSAGCYNANHEPKPLPVMIDKINEGFDWTNGLTAEQRLLVVSKCARKAAAAGFKAFGIMRQGECWSGPNAETTYATGGMDIDCKNDLGSDTSFTAYLFVDSLSR